MNQLTAFFSAPSNSTGSLVRLLGLWCVLLLAGVCSADGAQTDGSQVGDPPEPSSPAARDADQRQSPVMTKEDFDFGRSDILPAEGVLVQGYFKPGHWAALSQQVQANNFDFRGNLQLGPLKLNNVPYTLATSRAFTLTQGRMRSTEQVFYAPEQNAVSRQLQLPIELRRSLQGAKVAELILPAIQMPAHQYFMVVLSGTPTGLAYLRNLPTVGQPSASATVADYTADYRVVLVPETGRPLLPRHWSAWTSTAYLIWEDTPPDRLDADQQQAIIDWLHWGGQIILSGPGTLERLEASFLQPYLPATPAGTHDITPESLASLNDRWSGEERPLAATAVWPAQRLVPQADAQVLLELEGEPAIVERQIGRGRVVSVSFFLRQRELTIWPGFDGFFRSAILRRVPRIPLEERPPTAGSIENILSPHAVTDLRYFTRDTQTPYLATQEGEIVVPSPGSWSSYTPVCRTATNILRQASGITVPPAEFIVGLLSIYLIVLIPVNWLVFRLLGRVEWAWAAAPVITIIFSLIVVQMARLNIGFASTENQLNVVEIQGDYGRAHVTRYASLYSSISSAYRLTFADPGGVALPLPLANTSQDLLFGQQLTPLYFELTADPELSGFSVASNSLGMLHAEHMLDVGGGFELVQQDDRLTVINHSNIPVEHAVLIHQGRTAELGTLLPADRRTVELSSLQTSTRPAVPPVLDGTFDIEPLWKLILGFSQEGRAQRNNVAVTRLVGLAAADHTLDGVSFTPTATRSLERSIVIAQLEYAAGPRVTPDVIITGRGELEELVE